MFDNVPCFFDKLQDSSTKLREISPAYVDAYHEKVQEVLTFTQPERFVDPPKTGSRGRPQVDRRKLARAFVAQSTLGIRQNKELVFRLKVDQTLCALCGWSHYSEVPSESTLSRAFKEFAESKLPERIHTEMVKWCYQDTIVMNLSRDATDIPAREKSKKKKTPPKRKGGGPSKRPGMCEVQAASGKNCEELLETISKECDSGSKLSSKGTRMYWMGYKFHVDVADGCIPISCVLTSASVNDILLSIPLSQKSAEHVTALYELMDRGYCGKAVEQFIKDQGRVAVIEPTVKSRKEQLHITDNAERREAFRKEDEMRKFLNLETPEKKRLRNRTVVERFFSQLKELCGGRLCRLRSHAKISCHLMFGVVSLCAQAMMRCIRQRKQQV